ncbi:LacI family DNA-binding transcriptional regulator [Bauldia sp.]|uniref:LacI family DNA-binding transcriptional regulator n=1 Tax=Bauldia sp. TaxID=2575872 RepID=UPI003BAB799A
MSRRTTIIDIARRADVSAMTVSRYFNTPEKLAEETRVKVREAAEALDYIPNATVRAFFQGRTDTFALVVPSISDPFVMQIAQGVEDAAWATGYVILMCNTDSNESRERAYYEQLVSRRIDGIITLPTLRPQAEAEQSLDIIERYQIPAVVLLRQLEGQTFDTVKVDSYGGGRLLGEHFTRQGLKSVVFVGGTPAVESTRDRVRGLKDALSGSDVELDVRFGGFDQECGFDIASDIIAEGRRPDVIVSAMNVVAIGILKALKAADSSLPVASFGSLSTELRGLYDPLYAFIEHNPQEIGRRAVSALRRRLDDPDADISEAIVPVRLVVGDSTGAA